VFDLDHTLVSSPLDLRAVAREMEAFLLARGLSAPARELRWSGAELLALTRAERPDLEPELITIPQRHERAAMAAAALEPFALEAVAAMRGLGYATAIWTNNDRFVTDLVLARFGLTEHLDLVVTRDDVTQLKPHPDGLRVVRERWPAAAHIVVVGDAWVDGAAARDGGVPFIAYRADAAELGRRGVVPAAAITSLLDLPAALADADPLADDADPLAGDTVER
jgi:phosphoglycolate phosphatase-like HAD superfamily hydrolase